MAVQTSLGSETEIAQQVKAEEGPGASQLCSGQITFTVRPRVPDWTWRTMGAGQAYSSQWAVVVRDWYTCLRMRGSRASGRRLFSVKTSEVVSTSCELVVMRSQSAEASKRRCSPTYLGSSGGILYLKRH